MLSSKGAWNVLALNNTRVIYATDFPSLQMYHLSGYYDNVLTSVFNLGFSWFIVDFTSYNSVPLISQSLPSAPRTKQAKMYKKSKRKRKDNLIMDVVL